MNINLYDDLLSRRSFISKQLETSRSRLNRIALDDQMKQLNRDILEFESRDENVLAKAVVTFSGTPVDRSRGIQPVFASKVMTAFSDILDSLLDVHKFCLDRLYITGTALGSFGFTLEEKSETISRNEQVELDFIDIRNEIKVSPTKRALDQLIIFFQEADTETEQLSENISDMDDKTLDKIRKFINILSSNNALCSIKANNHKFSFLDYDHLQRIEETLIESNIKKEPKILTGHFIGILPKDRVGEFVCETETIKVKIPKSIEVPNDTRDILNQEITIRVIETSIKGKKPTYSLDKDQLDILVNISK